ncbi:MAG: hypothetical protein ACODAE_00675, partial [Gemmatimonadota bacterium]
MLPMRREDQERILTEIRCRLVEERLVESAGGGMPLEETIAGSIYHESRRLKEEPPSRARREDRLFWDDVRRRLRRAGERARGLAEGRLAWTRVAERFEAFYHEMLAGPRSTRAEPVNDGAER